MTRASRLAVVLFSSLAFCRQLAWAAPQASLSAVDRDALTRVAIAEAGDQGPSGQAGVVQTILNRLVAGGWGKSVEQIVNAPHQFEPVTRVGGDWRRLPRPSTDQQARIDTILQLIADGRVPDFIGGALYFQNPRIVAARIRAGAATPQRLNFGGRTPSAIVGDHAFYAAGVSNAGSQKHDRAGLFVDETQEPGAPPPVATDPSPAGMLFILPDGRLTVDALIPTPRP